MLINFQQPISYFSIQDGDVIKARKKKPVENELMLNDFQRRLAEQIKQQNVHESFQKAMEYNPESFVPVEMLYVNCHLNKHPIQAFIDTGAQKSVIGTKMAEACG